MSRRTVTNYDDIAEDKPAGGFKQDRERDNYNNNDNRRDSNYNNNNNNRDDNYNSNRNNDRNYNGNSSNNNNRRDEGRRRSRSPPRRRDERDNNNNSRRGKFLFFISTISFETRTYSILTNSQLIIPSPYNHFFIQIQ